jgi:hypothetical protein
MRKVVLPVLALACWSMSAQDFSLAIVASAARTTSGARVMAVPDNSAAYTYERASLPALGLEASWSFLALPMGALAVTGLYDPPVRKQLDVLVTRSLFGGGLPATTTSLRYTRGVTGIGIRWAGRSLLDWSLGLSYRGEAITLANGFDFQGGDANNKTVSATLWRPWLQGRLGISFPGVGLRPFVGMTWSKAMAGTTAGNAFDADLARHLAPDAELGVEVGLRF